MQGLDKAVIVAVNAAVEIQKGVILSMAAIGAPCHACRRITSALCLYSGMVNRVYAPPTAEDGHFGSCVIRASR